MSNKKCRTGDARGLKRGTKAIRSGVSQPQHPSRMSELIEAIDTVISKGTHATKKSKKN